MSPTQSFPGQRLNILIVYNDSYNVGVYINGELSTVCKGLGEFFIFLGRLLHNKMSIVYSYYFVADPYITSFPPLQNDLYEWDNNRKTPAGIPYYDKATAFIKKETDPMKEHVKFFCWLNDKGEAVAVYTREYVEETFEKMTGVPHTNFAQLELLVRDVVDPQNGWTQIWYGDDKFKSLSEIWEHHKK